MNEPKQAADRTALTETHCVGPNTREWAVRADACPALNLYHIKHVGVGHARTPYRMVRTHLSGTQMLACFGGEGRILLDGKWRVFRAGMACLAPPHVLHAFHCIPRVRWDFSWVRYEQPADQQPIIAASSPVLAQFDPGPLTAAIMGLYHENTSVAAPGAVHQWIEMIQYYVLRFSQPWHVDDRLWALWEAVAASLNQDWSLEKMSALTHYSSEHLRRLCRRQVGRSLMQQVTYLRMQKAASLLATTPDKIESIAEAVGYKNPFVFSNTFKKWIGWRPSEYRMRRKA